MQRKTPETIEIQIKEQLKKVMDPELGVSIIDLGLVYDIALSKDGICLITMTLTSMGCPLFPVIEKDIENRILEIPEIHDVKIELVFDPPWTPEKMSEEAKAQLGWNA